MAFKVPKFLIIWKLVNAFSALPKKKKKKASVWPALSVKVPAFVVQLREGAGSSRDTDSRQISETTMWGRILRQRAGTRF